MRTLQEKQSLTLQHQQSQCQMLMKQLQSQMEAEMLMKSELVRNQMQMLAQNGGDLSGNNNEILNEFLAGKLNNNNSDRQNSENSVKKQRGERLNAAHEE